MILSARHARLEPEPVAGWPGVLAWRVDNRVGESPTWNGATEELLWIDVRAPAVLRLHPRSGRLTRWTLPGVVGALGLIDADTVVLSQQHGLATLELGSGRWCAAALLEDEPHGNRLNDGKVSPSGRWWVFGSMCDAATDKQPTGALYCAGDSGAVRCLHKGLRVANGIAWRQGGEEIWFSDSHAGAIFAAPWDERRGVMGRPTLRCVSDEQQGRPDGAAIDQDGNYWSAGVSAGCLNRFSGDGEMTRKLPLPCRFPTMPCFGGAGLDRLFVTSLVRPDATPDSLALDGALIELPAPVAGVATALWAPGPAPLGCC
ncbi:MAG: SMP-30/gluconolactonase/LRE family protein [Rhizobiales bacterium]|nr:SMP-30/gluconolactonase/LRE family protein [Rhizobacter sp.]